MACVKCDWYLSMHVTTWLLLVCACDNVVVISPYMCCVYFRCDWEKLLEFVQCKILSACSNETLDAYLLR